MRPIRTSDIEQCMQLVRDPSQPADARRQALARIPAPHLPAFLWRLEDGDLPLLFGGFDFTSVSKGWCLHVAMWGRSPAIARRAFKYVVDRRVLRSGLDPGRPAWMIEDSARRLGVNPPFFQNLLEPVKPSPLIPHCPTPWIPPLLEASPDGCRQTDCRDFGKFRSDVAALGKLPKLQRNFFRRLETNPSSLRESYITSPRRHWVRHDHFRDYPKDVAPSEPDPLLERLNAPVHFRVKPGWAIGYGSSFYHGHHGEIRGTFVSEIFTHRTDATFTIHPEISDSARLNDLFFLEEEDRPPTDFVPVRFDLEGIDLPNTEEALLELASILRLPEYPSINPQAWPQRTEHDERIPRVVLSDAWSGLILYEEGRRQGEGHGSWGHVQTAIFRVELVVIWQPFPLLGVQTSMIERKETRNRGF